MQSYYPVDVTPLEQYRLLITFVTTNRDAKLIA